MQAYGSFSKAFKDLLVLGTGVEHDSTLLVGENLAINQGFCDKKNCPTQSLRSKNLSLGPHRSIPLRLPIAMAPSSAHQSHQWPDLCRLQNQAGWDEVHQDGAGAELPVQFEIWMWQEVDADE